MFKNLSVLTIVPARGGSKRVTGKNKRPIAGLPLISWTLKACTACEYIDEIVVSTDDAQIKEIAQSEGVSRIQKRPANLASDTSPTIDTVTDVIESLEQKGKYFDLIFLAQPTSPLRTSEHISSAFDLLTRKYPVSVVGVAQSPHPKEWQGYIGADGDMESFLSGTSLGQGSHTLPTSYVINGAIYIAPRELLLAEKTFFPPGRLTAFFMSERDSIDIDTELDFEIAEYLLSNR